jgi:hypothetical protein
MAEDIYISTTNADGHEIHGSYRVSGEFITVTLSDGNYTRTSLRGQIAEEYAKILLLKLDRKSRGVS